MVTIKDVARAAGVSTATISRVVHNGGNVGDECRARVKKIIEEMGYRPNSNAQALVNRSSKTIGIVTPKLSMSFFGSLASGVEKAAREINYKLLMTNSLYEKETEQAAIDSLREHNCKSIIIHSDYSDEKTLAKLAKEIPGLVVINRFLPSLANRCVWLDNVSGGQQIGQYLLEKGHKEFAVVTSVYKNRDPDLRVQGLLKALEDEGITIPSSLIAQSTSNMEGGALAARALIESGKKFTAVVAYNDLMAVGLMNELQDQGIRVPEDVSVVGFDNLDIANACRPRLTTMCYPIEEMAAYATELSIELAQENKKLAQKTHLFMPTLIERNSVRDLTQK
ncbi:LacI family DNA-binding transcriptional regulator [Catenovulum maritimum]|uniref:Transcriptional regulator n=1 Tax=Catenovulum maritimum TaxID=1513271 RepID=A0A0J8H0Z4_9ALTE|nr:LacI family DNA-binding transcriptional regulator [Catenovulum maritimum]KMT66688.1 transcriptional regulator [Catenovulum maritimum]